MPPLHFSKVNVHRGTIIMFVPAGMADCDPTTPAAPVTVKPEIPIPVLSITIADAMLRSSSKNGHRWTRLRLLGEQRSTSPGSITLWEQTGHDFPALFQIRPTHVAPAGEMAIDSQGLGEVAEIPAPRRRATRARARAGPSRRKVDPIMHGSSHQ
jgi:hypothetical protein